MDYLEMIKSVPSHRLALIENNCPHTYGELASEASMLRESLSPEDGPSLAPIRESSVCRQLLYFIAYSGTHKIPLLIPHDVCHLTDDIALNARGGGIPPAGFSSGGIPPAGISSDGIPPAASMAVLTSGTTGRPRIWYRSFESWHSFFPIQNTVFGITGSTRMFIHGSLAFTGNLNMCLGLLYAGAAIITADPVHPFAWDQSIGRHCADSIYLIPSKLRLMARFVSCVRPAIKEIVSGSQSLGLSDVKNLKQIYPNCRCTLYYGASELSYVSYLTDSEMDDNCARIGKPFPGVRTDIADGLIYVHTPYGAEGISMPYSAGDMGCQDADGCLIFLGRRDHVYNIHGRKISAVKIENSLQDISGVAEAAVTLEKDSILAAHVVMWDLPDPQVYSRTAAALNRQLSLRLESWEIPRKYYFPASLPKSSSGKRAEAVVY